MTIETTLEADVEPVFVLPHRDHSALRARLSDQVIPEEQPIGRQLRALMYEREGTGISAGRTGKGGRAARRARRVKAQLASPAPRYVEAAPARLF